MQYIKYLSVTAVMLLIGGQFLSAQEREWEIGDTSYAQKLLDAGKRLTQEGKLIEALSTLQMAEDIYIQTTGETTKEIAIVYDQIGQVLAYMNKFDESITHFEKALNIRKQIYREGDIQVVISLNNLALALQYNDEYERAGKYYEESLKLILELYGEDHKNTPIAYSNLGTNYNNRGEYKKSIECDSQALRLRIKMYGEDSPEVAKSYNNLGINFQDIGDFDKSIELHKKALSIRLKALGFLHKHTAYSYLNLGTSYMDKGDYQRQLEYLQKAFEIDTSLYGDESPEIISTYNNIGVGYINLGDYERAISYLSKALFLEKKYYGKKHIDIATTLNNIGICYSSLKDYQKATEYQKDALEIRLEVFGHNHRTVADSYNNLGTIAYDRKDFKESVKFHQKALELRKSLLGKEHPDVASSNFNLGLVYEEKGELNIAQTYYQSALNENIKVFGGRHPEVAKVYRALASIAIQRQSFTEAESLLKKSFGALSFQSGHSLSSISSIPGLLLTQNTQINLFNKKYDVLKHNSYLHASRRAYQEAFETIQYQSELSSSKSILRENIQSTFEGAIIANHSLYSLTDSAIYLKDAFFIAENAKAQLLYASIKESNALKFSGIPDSLLQREYDLRIDMTYLDKKRRALLQKDYEAIDTTVLSLSNQIFDLEQELEALKKQFEEAYPAYHRLKYDRSTISISEVQQELLKPDQALLEYFVGDSSIFIFLIPKEGAPILKEVKKDFPLEDWVAKFREGVSNTNKVKTYLKYAQLLYDSLIQPVAEQLPERVIIVPDGVLGYLPFSALLSGQPGNIGNPKTYPFLLKEHQFSYSYSATLLKEMRDKEHRHQAEGQLLAFAPFFESEIAGITEQRSDAWKKLPFTGPEVKRVASFFPKKYLIFSGKKATKEAFLQDAAHYRFLHIATHGQADDRVGDYSFLVFASPTDTSTAARLFVRELYNLELNADMVVLSACQVGAGQLQRGEGIISLARAFAYAGAKSLVFPIWSVNDGKTAELMGYFYKYLAEGAPKDEALRSAQLKYLDQQPSNFAKHPAFWAAFSAVGDMRAINQ